MTDDCFDPVLLSDEDSEPVLLNFTHGSEPVLLSAKDSEAVLLNFTQDSEPVLLNFSRDDFQPEQLDFSIEESEPGNISSCTVSTTSTPKKVAESTLQTGTYPLMDSKADLELSGGSAGLSYLSSFLQDSGLTLEESTTGKQYSCMCVVQGRGEWVGVAFPNCKQLVWICIV